MQEQLTRQGPSFGGPTASDDDEELQIKKPEIQALLDRLTQSVIADDPVLIRCTTCERSFRTLEDYAYAHGYASVQGVIAGSDGKTRPLETVK